jgi:myo-inositol-hexaphosphate 3-phosphohydrolase
MSLRLVSIVLALSATLHATAWAQTRGPGSTGVSSVTGVTQRAATKGIWLTREEIMALPMSGAAWNAVKAQADKDAGTPDLSNQDQMNNVYVLAKALVYARTGIETYRTEVVLAVLAAMGTEDGGRTLALGRELAAYVIAADLVGLDAVDDEVFKTWLRGVLTETLDGMTLVSTHERRPNNWGTHAGASRAAAVAYLGDAAELARCAQVFKGWVGDRSSYAGFTYGDLDWQCDPNAPVGINPVGCTKEGHSIDGVLPDDQRRDGGFTWPPPCANYVQGALDGAVVQMEILRRAGYLSHEWESRAILRAYKWAFEVAGCTFDGDNQWSPHVVNKIYGTSFPAAIPASPGKNMAWTDWTHASSGGGSTPSDGTPPTVSLSAPSDGATVSGTVTVSASASDDVGVAGVQFKLDGANLGSEDLSSPYSLSWNTTSVTNGSHVLTAVARDAAGNTATSAPVNVTVSNSTSDTTPPVISGVASSSITSSSATIQWTTNEPADTQVEYGTTTAYGYSTTLQTSLVTSHGATLSGLTASTLYHYRAKSRDAAGNLAVSPDFTFTTSAASSGPVTVLPTVETDPSHHSGDTADDAAIWIHPTDPSLSLVVGDDKDGGLMVYGLDGRELQYVEGTNYNNLDLRYNFPLAGQFSNGAAHQQVALVAVGDELGKQIDFFKVNAATRRLEAAGSINTANGLVPYGFCMYLSPVTGKYYAIVNAKSGVTQQYELQDGGGGNVTGTMVREFDVGTQPEGCVADDVLGHLYIGEEVVGVWKYGAEPGTGSTRTQVDKTGSGGHLSADVEGMAIYYTSSGNGYLLVSSQGNSTIAVYTREGDNAYLGSFSVGANGTIDAVTDTDGLDVTNLPLGTGFSKGLFVLHDASNSGGSASNYKYVPWESIANAMGLTIDTSWDPRLVGGGGGGDLTPPARITDLSVATGSTTTTSGVGKP